MPRCRFICGADLNDCDRAGLRGLWTRSPRDADMSLFFSESCNPFALGRTATFAKGGTAAMLDGVELSKSGSEGLKFGPCEWLNAFGWEAIQCSRKDGTCDIGPRISVFSKWRVEFAFRRGLCS